MAYSKTNLKSNGDKIPPYFRPFWIGKLSDMFTYIDFAISFIQTHFSQPN
jgi:hypothetical protein